MFDELKLPTGREWKPYVLRHSLATLVRNRGAERWDLEGHGPPRSSQTETYAIGEFPSVQRALTTITEEIERAAPGSLHWNHTGSRSPFPTARELEMPG